MAILILTAIFLSVNIEASIENKGLEVRVYNSYQEFINDTQTYNRSVEVGAILTAGVVGVMVVKIANYILILTENICMVV